MSEDHHRASISIPDSSDWEDPPRKEDLRVESNVSFEEVLEAAETIWFSVQTCWWTHRKEDLACHPESGLPCDPRGGVLMQAGAESFLDVATEHPEDYGPGGLETFILAHHANCQRRWRGQWYPWCFTTWEPYEELRDAGAKDGRSPQEEAVVEAITALEALHDHLERGGGV